MVLREMPKLARTVAIDMEIAFAPENTEDLFPTVRSTRRRLNECLNLSSKLIYSSSLFYTRIRFDIK